MKQTHAFVQSIGTVTCEVASGRRVAIPAIPGILKHPMPDELIAALSSPATARKYTVTALQKCAWPILRQFPSEWLKQCMPHAKLSPSRHAALTFLLS